MKEKDNTVYYNGIKYIIINSVTYIEKKYIFVMNYNDIKDVKLLVCLNELIEVDDIDLIKKIMLMMIK